MNGFIVSPSYKIIDDKAFVHLYGRLENGESFVAIIERKAYFYIKKADQEKAEDLLPLDFEEVDFTNFDGEPVVRVVLKNPKNVPDVRSMLLDKQITCYEADILFAYRYLIDLDLKGSIHIKGQSFSSKEYFSLHNKQYDVDKVFLNPEITQGAWEPELKILSFDIETDIKAEQLLSLSVVCDDFSKVFIAKKGLWKDAESFETEKEVLLRFLEVVKELDPDIITGWNMVDFDLDVLRKLYKKYNIPFAIGRDPTPLFLKLSESFFQDSVAKIEGRAVLDGISILKSNFISLPDYKLQTAAEVFLGKGKLMHGDGRFTEIEDAFHNDTQKMIDYNLLDSQLVLEILEKTNVINLTIARSKLTRMQLDRVKASIASLDSLYLDELRKIKVVAPTSFNADREERITGGYVRESKPGIYDNVIVLDFKSLYPSIIRTFNIDPYRFVSPEKFRKIESGEDFSKDQFIEAPNGAYFSKETGILPGIIQGLWEQRDIAKQEKDEAKSYAIKITMNSFFGVLANPNCRFYSIDIANAITHFGQFLIKLTADEMEKKGYEVIYGDTDSIFIDVKDKEYDAVIKKGDDIQVWINDFFKKYIKEQYGLTSKMEIEFEKVYKKFFMPSVRGSVTGAKKRYAGILLKDGEEKLDFVGLEFVRSDWTELAKSFQYELLNKVFNDEKVTDYIRGFIKDLRTGKFDEKVVYRKQIRKPVSSYTKTTPPHIQAARKIGREDVGVIYYVMTTDGPEEIEHKNHDIDYEHYIIKQIKPIADSVLAFYDEEFENLTSAHKQQSLFDF